MPEQNLLIISNKYPNHDTTFTGDIFVKEQVDHLKKYFNTVYVISPVAHGMEQARSFRYCTGSIRQRLSGIRHEDYQYDNVIVSFPKYTNNPLWYHLGRSRWADREADAIISLIQEKGYHIDLIHAHFTWPCGAVAVRIKDTLDLPVVITEHNTPAMLEKPLRSKDPSYHTAWKKSDAIIRVNKGDIPLFIKYGGIPPEKIHYIGNGYNPAKCYTLSKDTARTTLNIPDDVPVLLNISRLNQQKGQKHLIQALPEVLSQFPACRCYIGGSGPEREKLSRIIKEYGIEDNCILTGFLPDDEIPLWMNACDIFVLPSLHESFGIVQIEAMACGKPVVATRNGGSEEIITSDTHGLLCRPADPADLAEKIKEALLRTWDSDKLTEYAAGYTWENVAGEINKIYQKVLKETNMRKRRGTDSLEDHHE